MFYALVKHGYLTNQSVRQVLSILQLGYLQDSHAAHILLIVIYFTQWFIYLRASKTYVNLYFLK